MPRILLLLTATALAAADPAPHPLAAAAATDAVRAGRIPAAMDRDRDGRWSPMEIVIAAARSPDRIRRDLPATWALIDRNRDGRAEPRELAEAVASGPGAGFSVAEKPKRMGGALTPAGAAGAGNGLRAGSGWVAFGSETAYISGYDVVDGQLDPQVSVLRTGTVLVVGDIVITTR